MIYHEWKYKKLIIIEDIISIIYFKFVILFSVFFEYFKSIQFFICLISQIINKINLDS